MAKIGFLGIKINDQGAIKLIQEENWETIMPKSSRTRNSTLNLMTGFAGQLLIIILKFVTRTVFIHTLGASYLGINGLFSDILSMLSITELGFDTAINFRLYKPLAEHDEKRVRVLLKFYKWAYRLVGLAIIVIGLLLIPLLRYIIADYDSLEALGINAVLIFIIYLLQSASSYLFFAYRSAVIKADQKTYIIDIADMAVTVATNIVQICILVFLRDFVLYTATVVLFNIIMNLVNALIARRMYPAFFKKEEASLSRSEVVDLLKDCGALLVYRINTVVVKATDNIVLSAFMGLVVVGLYSNYLLFYTTIRTLLDRFYSAFKASLGNLYATADVVKNYFMFEVTNFISMILYGTACVGVAVVADELVLNWIGPDYVVAQPLSILIGIEILFVGIKLNLGQVRNVSGAFRQLWFRPVIGIMINLGVSLALVQVLGIYGVLIGTISADVLANFLVDPSVIHKYSFKNIKPVSRYYRKHLVYFLILAVVEVIDFLICDNFLTNMGWFSVIFHIVICGVSVPIVFIGIYWKTEECKYVRNKVIEILKNSKNKLLKR